MKRIVALMLCLVLLAGLMTGCQKKMDVKTLCQKMDEVMKGQNGTAMKMDAEIEMTMGIAGMTMTMGMDLDLDLRYRVTSAEELGMYMDGIIAMEVLGETQEIDMEMYVDAKDGQAMMYMHEGMSDTWTKSTVDTAELGAEEMMEPIVTFSEIPLEQMSLAEEKQTVNGKECYVLTANLDGTYFAKAMETAMATQQELDEETKAMMDAMDLSKLTVNAVYYVDCETFLAVQMSAEILGMGDVMNSMLSGVMSEMLLGEGVEMEMTIDVPVCKINITEVAYGDVEIPAVPQEAIDNAIDADAILEDEALLGGETVTGVPPQADGSYLLTLGGPESVRVMVPAEMVYVDAGTDYVSGTDENMTSYLNYMLLPDVTGNDMHFSMLSEVTWAEDNGYYKSHSEIEELNGFETMSLIYNDNTSMWYAWKELGGCLLVLGAEVEGETFDLAAMIATVEIAVE